MSRYVEVLLRNTLDVRLSTRHAQLRRPDTWLDDPARELTDRARRDIADARRRVRAKKKRPTHGQTVSELSFGFWRYLISKTYSGRFWPDLASGFPHAPDRALTTIERPVRELHAFRNRLGHHQRIWSEPLVARRRDLDVVTSTSWLAPSTRPSPTGWPLTAACRKSWTTVPSSGRSRVRVDRQTWWNRRQQGIDDVRRSAHLCPG